MCGIVGLIDASGKYNNGEFVEQPIAMAMRRLSIIDLEHDWQPFFSDGNQVAWASVLRAIFPRSPCDRSSFSLHEGRLEYPAGFLCK